MKPTVTVVAAMACALAAHVATAEEPSSAHAGHHAMMMKQAADGATEPGQGAFAAIAEAVRILQADPDTDWSRVSIDRLREHLVDMDEVTLHASVATEETDDRVVFRITGAGRTRQAIQSMVPTHAAVLAESTPWKVTAERTEDGAVMTVRSEDAGVRQRIRALGFFGMMTLGHSHPLHHMMMARGMRHGS